MKNLIASLAPESAALAEIVVPAGEGYEVKPRLTTA